MFSRHGLLITAFGLVLTAPASGQQLAPEPPVEPVPMQQQSSEKPAIEPLLIPEETNPANILIPKHDESSAQKAGKESGQSNQIWWHDDILAQWVMAITGMLALLVSVWAVWLLKRTLEETRKAVEAAYDTVKVTRELGQTQIRAYLAFNNLSWNVAVDAEKKRIIGVVFYPKIRNTGASPAFITKIYNQIIYLESTTPDVEVTHEFEDYGEELLVCGSGLDISFISPIAPITDIVECSQRKKRAFLVFYVRYRDVFSTPSTQEHIFTGCTEIEFRALPSVYDINTGVPNGAIWTINRARHSITMKSKEETHRAN